MGKVAQNMNLNLPKDEFYWWEVEQKEGWLSKTNKENCFVCRVYSDENSGSYNKKVIKVFKLPRCVEDPFVLKEHLVESLNPYLVHF